MTKIAFIGAGSGFGQRISADILAHPEFVDCTISLVDIHEGNLAGVHGYVQDLIDRYNLPAKVEATTNRREVLEGADYVVIAVAIGGPAYDGVPYYNEVQIPKKYGISQSVADTCSIGAIFRMLRTGPEMVRIAHDPDTRVYFERRVKEGRTKRDVIRILKRYVAREVYRHLPRG